MSGTLLLKSVGLGGDIIRLAKIAEATQQGETAAANQVQLARTNVSSVDRWRVTSYTEVMPRNRLSATWDRSPAKVACVLISSNPVSGEYLPKGRWLRILMLSKLLLLESGTNPVPHDC
jgi:hypothetical protein